MKIKTLLLNSFSVIILFGCKTVPVSNGDYHMREFNGSYNYRYMSSEKDGDSVLIVGKVFSQTKTIPTIVEFRANSLPDDEIGVFAYCDSDGKFSIKLKKDSYDIYAKNDKFEIGIWLRTLGHYGNKVELLLYPQYNSRQIY